MKRSDLVPSGHAVVGCYSVDVYCEHPHHMRDYINRDRSFTAGYLPDLPASATGETRAQCLRKLRRDGWWIARDESVALCPYHAKRVPR